MVKEAEAYLMKARFHLEELQTIIHACKKPYEKKKLENSLEQDRVRYAQMMADVVIFKAINGIFTDPEEIKKLK